MRVAVPRRRRSAAEPTIVVGDPENAMAVLRPRFLGLEQEMFCVLLLNIRNMLVSVHDVALGTACRVEVVPRDVFRAAIRDNAVGIVLAHNHPSGDPTPSNEDVELTRRLVDVGRLVGIPVVDHLVVAGTRWRSIAEIAPQLFEVPT